MAKTGADLGFPEGHPFHDAEVISEYGFDRAVEDGVFVVLGPTLSITSNAAARVAPAEGDDPFDATALRRIVSAIVSEYASGNYACPRWIDEHGEADAGLALYMVDAGKGCLMDEGLVTAQRPVKVWAIPGGTGLQLMLPEDY